MRRNLGALVDARIDDASILLETPSGLLLLGMIIMSLSIISMVIFACGDGGGSHHGGHHGGGCGGGDGGGC